MAARMALAAASSISRPSVAAAKLVPRRGLAGGGDHHGPPRINIWEDPLSPSKWKEEHFVLTTLAGWGLLIYGGYKLFGGKDTKDVIPTATNTTGLNLRSILEKEKFAGPNFSDWYRQLKIVLKAKRKLYVLESAMPAQPAANAARAVRDAYEKHVSDSTDVACLMLASMTPELQR